MAKRYRAVVGLSFADGDKETRIEAGQLIPERFKIPKSWIASGKVEPK